MEVSPGDWRCGGRHGKLTERLGGVMLYSSLRVQRGAATNVRNRLPCSNDLVFVPDKVGSNVVLTACASQANPFLTVVFSRCKSGERERGTGDPDQGANVIFVEPVRRRHQLAATPRCRRLEFLSSFCRMTRACQQRGTRFELSVLRRKCGVISH